MLDFALATQIKMHEVPFNLVPELWDKFSCDGIDLSTIKWKETKFLTEDGKSLNTGMKSLPNDKGGIYLFYVKCDILPEVSNYLMYIGRARITENHSLRVRCRKYFYEYSHNNERPKIQRLVEQWGKNLYLKYIELEDNDLITRLEKCLISSILPPSNDDFVDKKVNAAKKAFN